MTPPLSFRASLALVLIGAVATGAVELMTGALSAQLSAQTAPKPAVPTTAPGNPFGATPTGAVRQPPPPPPPEPASFDTGETIPPRSPPAKAPAAASQGAEVEGDQNTVRQTQCPPNPGSQGVTIRGNGNQVAQDQCP
jgi:hypothetical protein